jgi:hypothetical protein
MQLRELLIIGLSASIGCSTIGSPGAVPDGAEPGSDTGSGGDDQPGPAPTGLVSTLFRGGPYRTPIAATPRLDPRGAEYVALLDVPLAANTFKFGVTVRYSHATDPSYRIAMTPPGGADIPLDRMRLLEAGN